MLKARVSLVAGFKAFPPVHRLPLHSKACGVAGLRALSTGGVDRDTLAPKIREFIDEQVKLCQPKDIHVCDGSEAENAALLKKLQEDGRIRKLDKYENW